MKGGLILVAITALAWFGSVNWHAQSHVNLAKPTAARQQIKSFFEALRMYAEDTGSYPPTHHGLQALRAAPKGVRGWHGPYLPQEIPTDPWNRAYIYSNDGAPKIASLGADGQPGGEGPNADITQQLP